jgi:hypothetical protein
MIGLTVVTLAIILFTVDRAEKKRQKAYNKKSRTFD